MTAAITSPRTINSADAAMAISRKATPSPPLRPSSPRWPRCSEPLNLTADEAIRLVEQLYGSVLDMDVALAGEADDTRKSSTLAYIQNTTIGRDGDKLASGISHSRGVARGHVRAAEPAAAAETQAGAHHPGAGRRRGGAGDGGRADPRDAAAAPDRRL